MMPVPVLIAHRSRLLCSALSALFTRDRDIWVVGCATNRQEAEEILPEAQVVLVDSGLEGAQTLSYIYHIHHLYPQVKVVVSGVENCPQTILRFLEAGAAGYVLDSDSAEELLPRIRAAAQGKALVPPRVMALVIKRLKTLGQMQRTTAHQYEQARRLSELTSRQREVLALIAAGASNEEISDRLVIECGTVKNHVHNIPQRLGVASRHEAAALFRLAQRHERPPTAAPSLSALASAGVAAGQASMH